jgi:hypothetical protein
MNGSPARGDEASGVHGVAGPLCPACGPVAGKDTSRYCARHIAELRAQWRAICALRLGSRAA